MIFGVIYLVVGLGAAGLSYHLGYGFRNGAPLILLWFPILSWGLYEDWRDQ